MNFVHKTPLAGDRLDQLVGENLPRLIAFIRSRMGDRIRAMESARDIAQSVCRDLLQQQPSNAFSDEAAFRGWIFRQALHKLVTRHRYYMREKRDLGRLKAGNDDEADTASLLDCYATVITPSRIANAREQLERIEAGIAQLPADQRDAVVMVKMVGLSSVEAGQILDKSDSSLRGLVARGLANLAMWLREH